MTNLDIRNPTTGLAKLIWHKFIVPLPVFELIVENAKVQIKSVHGYQWTSDRRCYYVS